VHGDISLISRDKLRNWIESETYFQNNSKIRKQSVIQKFNLDQSWCTKDIPRFELENFFLQYNQSDLDVLIHSVKTAKVDTEKKSSVSEHHPSPSTTSSTSRSPSISRNFPSNGSLDSPSSSIASSPETSRSSLSNSLSSTRSRKNSADSPPLRPVEDSKVVLGSDLTTNDKKRSGIPNSVTTVEFSTTEFNPKAVTPEDYRKRAGVMRAHTWTLGVPLTPLLANRLRRRLSMTHDPEKPYILDGIPDASQPRLLTMKKPETKKPDAYFAHFASFSHVGLIPFNKDKVNQDRCAAIAPYEATDRGFFGVFDGHGSNGHEVAEFCAKQLPRSLAEELEKLKKKRHETHTSIDEKDYIGRAFYKTFELLKTKSGIECTYSGSTAILCLIQGETLFACNVGDSRAVLAVQVPDTSEDDKRYVAVPLSSDQTPARDDEKKRILKCGGRIEPCQDEDNCYIGPLRVWLKHRSVPGLAMTRSFGDLVATPVGVSPVPEIYERKLEKMDSFIIIASDGLWEFISNQEAVDIVASAGGDPQRATELLYIEADKRWRKEEEVIDDITALVLYLDCGSLNGLSC